MLTVAACGSTSGGEDGERAFDGGLVVDAAIARDGGPDTDAGDTEADAGTGELDCASRPLLGQGSLDHWQRKTSGPNVCLWEGRAPSPFADCRFFDQVWPSPWPSNSVRRDLFVEGNEGRQFIALEFDSGDIPTDLTGRIMQEVPQFGGASSGVKMWSFSRCPGDFNKDLIDAEMGPGCVREDRFGVTQSFGWGGPSDANVMDPDLCALQPDTRYYLNIVFTEADAGTPPEDIEPNPRCVSARCGVPLVMSGSYSP